ncbi:hypothetical protein CFB52_000020 [Burkholderia sp. AU18528]|nr:GIY-YIG nuclease family protein [Burkholderia semiarida]PHP91266.1 hypothetical protein CFB52_000020 [Burkholderia sp. AU18528]
MLDYTERTRADLGVVTFATAAARYVPRTSGIYQLIPIPYSYSELAYPGLAERYLQALHGGVLSMGRPIAAEVMAATNKLLLSVSQAGITPHSHFGQCAPEALISVAIMFPPIYIGQASDLKVRFLNHLQGRGSRVREEMQHLGLSDCLTYFRWTEVSEVHLDSIEAVLIKTHQPILNTLLR